MKWFDVNDELNVQSVDAIERSPLGDPLEAVNLADRGLPAWASYLAFFFAIAASLCVLALALSLHVFQTIVAVQKDSIAAGAIWLVTLVPVFGLVILDYAQNRSLTGLQGVRRKAILNANAVSAVFLAIALGFIHPFLTVPIALAAAVAGIGVWLAKQFGRVERLWDFTPAEAVSVLTGRDQFGFRLAKSEVGKVSPLTAVSKLPTPLGLVSSAAMASWLVAQDILVLPAVAAVVCLSTWIAHALGQWVYGWAQSRSGRTAEETIVMQGPVPADLLKDAGPNSVVVHGLTATVTSGPRILSDVSFNISAGEFVGVVGETASGKSALLRAIIDPFSMGAMTVQGGVYVRDQNLWFRSTQDQSILAAHLEHCQRILPFSGRENLLAFQGKGFLDRAQRSLVSLVYSDSAVRRILNAPDATQLSLSDQRALEYARMFFLSPQFYVLDRPENAATPALVKALAKRLAQEKQAGRSAIIATEDRNLLALCDRIIVMQDGRVIDQGPAQEIQDRAQSGWQRFACERQLESEDTLTAWVRSQFRREGDDNNLRAACSMAAELLAFSCADQVVMDGERLHFDFKHFEGHIILRVTDTGQLLSSGQMQRAQNAAHDNDTNLKHPLARIMRGAASFEQALSDGRRVISVKVRTVDPRSRKLRHIDGNTGQQGG